MISFFNSYLGMFIAQTFCHSIIAFVVVNKAMQIWDINDPLIRQRFHIIVVLLPIFSFPAYQIINPDRVSISFRMESLFDINQWLYLEIFEIMPLWIFFVSILFITTANFLFQELFPALKNIFESKNINVETEENEEHPIIKEAIADLSAEKPDILVLEDDDYIFFSTTGRNAAVFISTGIIKTLDKEQLQAAIAHEMAHIARNKKPLLIAVFLFRAIMFFNPVVLLEFRRAVQEEEKICDDMAIRLTQKPHALSGALKKLYYKNENANPLKLKKLSEMRDSIEEYSHNVHIEDRIHRLEKGGIHKTDGEWLKLLLTVIVIIGINYFIV